MFNILFSSTVGAGLVPLLPLGHLEGLEVDGGHGHGGHGHGGHGHGGHVGHGERGHVGEVGQGELGQAGEVKGRELKVLILLLERGGLVVPGVGLLLGEVVQLRPRHLEPPLLGSAKDTLALLVHPASCKGK
jgi:hypothetical protein